MWFFFWLLKIRQPYQQALSLFNKFLQTPYYLPEERLAMVETITYDDLVKMVNSNEFLNGLSVESLIQGNIVENEARDLLKMVEGILVGEKLFLPNSVETRRSNEDVALLLGTPSKAVNLIHDVDTIDDKKKSPIRIRARQMTSNVDEKNNAVLLGIEVILLLLLLLLI